MPVACVCVCRSSVRAAVVALLVLGGRITADAQTIVVLNQPVTQVTDTTIRGGAYADANYVGQDLITKSHSDASYVRHAILKFDTENTVPLGTTIVAATLTVTVASGGTDATRPIAAYQVLNTFQSDQATWHLRKTSTAWSTAGADLGMQLAQASAGNAAGTRISFNVTKLVQLAVSGSLGSSRYTRIAMVDVGAPSGESYRSYYSSSSANATARPTLTVTLASTTPAPSSSTIRVMEWNTHHGGWRTDGVWDPQLLMQWVAKLNPDIVALEEVERNTSWSGGKDDLALFLSLLQQLTGKTWYGVFVVGSGATSGIGNAILSKTPFISTSTHLLGQSRSVVHAAIDWNGRPLNFFGTHLDADSSGYRLAEISALKTWVAGFAEQRIIAGDFNASPGSSEFSAMTTAYTDAWTATQTMGTAIAFPDNPAGNTRNGRIDYMFTSTTAASLTLKSAQVFDTRDAKGVMPSDHRPLMVIYGVK
ncbi:MAG: Endonuclease/Exonuclease/phosphatase family protein [Acidobacteria bacterium]|nr:Endonuclease/Exonuclease/phosphatase family protein [Acidobacteriota bacterium]